MRFTFSVRDHSIINIRAMPVNVLGVFKLPPLITFPWRHPACLREGPILIVLLVPAEEVTLDEGCLPCL